MNHKNLRSLVFFKNQIVCSLILLFFGFGCSDEDLSTDLDPDPDPQEEVFNPDVNEDGSLNILVIGTSKSIKNNGEAFSPDLISSELQNILSSEVISKDLEINVIEENIYKSKQVTLGLGGGGTIYNWNHYSHSLVQYYYWPEGLEARMENLSGNGDYKWDYVVIAADPYIISKIPGFYSLGVHKIATKVSDGGAKPLLLMMWSKEETQDHFEEFTYRAADGADVDLPVIPAGIAWENLSESKKENVNIHPSPNGAYLTAASIFSHIYGKSATESTYVYDDDIANLAFSTLTTEADKEHYTGEIVFNSPFDKCNIEDNILHFNHTGTSSENGILGGLRWVLGKDEVELVRDGTPPIHFNYGRANTNFEAGKRYKIDPARFDFSFGFPMQDHGNNGNTSMLYGIDKRLTETENGTDLGVALFMERENELPYGRAVPIRTLFAQIKEEIPNFSAYRDSWHMSRDLDKAIGAYMYTILTGNCSLGEEPANKDSNEWRTWFAQKTGHTTAWKLMYLNGNTANCN
ncbi:hypothetical protein [Ascidiimonas sp. W6]|uniref:hypothetical protein n=1 Tax=Ascidiimonas meishanensis TaxID=3128903 RepID=UPI0030EE56A8